jgi:hypothetical protein
MPALPPGWLGDTVALYARVFRQGARLALANWPVGLLVIVYGVLVEVAALVAAPLGIIGPFLVAAVFVACASSWLSLVAHVLRVGRIRLQDVPSSFATYFFDLMNVGFLFWLLRWVASIVLEPFPFLQLLFALAVLVFLNAVPELVYVGRHSAAEVLVESYRFIGENWIEWFPANLLLAVAVVAVWLLPAGPLGLLQAGAVGTVLYFAMIVRGLLFRELITSSRRGREFRRRAAG